MNAKNEAMEWLDSGNDNIYDAEEIIENLLKELEAAEKTRLNNNPKHESVDAFWKEWERVGVPHKHGYYESTWMAFNAAYEALKEYKANQGDSDE